jgi:glycosyltransferase involved in cell wall biosynthesis
VHPSSLCYTEIVNSPKVSVIIAARDEAAHLPDCLASLQAQKTEFPFEVIVVDNCSQDNTLAIAKSFGVRVFSELSPGTPKARNLGAKKALGEILVFTDADCSFPPNWLEEIAAPLLDPNHELPIGVVGGKVTSAFVRPDWPNLFEHFADRLFYLWEERDRMERFPGFLPWAPTCNLAIKKELFEDLGGFEERWTIGYDPDLCWRAALN